jgi:WhiB family redox-sensing transcriptional regulator
VTTADRIATTDPAAWRPPDTAPCRATSSQGVNFFPDRTSAEVGWNRYDAGRSAKAICAGCPLAAPCVTAAVARNERWAIWGGAGGGRRRALRRWWGTEHWPDALAAHMRDLHGQRAQPDDDRWLKVGGAERECGKRGTFATGCRCDPCSVRAGVEGAMASTRFGRSLSPAVAAWAEGVAA